MKKRTEHKIKLSKLVCPKCGNEHIAIGFSKRKKTLIPHRHCRNCGFGW